jgi:hypothetical protein
VNGPFRDFLIDLHITVCLMDIGEGEAGRFLPKTECPSGSPAGYVLRWPNQLLIDYA